MKYPKDMDKECIALCDALNSLKGVRTFESCCGHLKGRYEIFFSVSNWYSLSLLARAADWRYGGCLWELSVISGDIPKKKSGVAVFVWRSALVFESQKQMDEAIEQAVSSIERWKDKRYESYLKGKEK